MPRLNKNFVIICLFIGISTLTGCRNTSLDTSANPRVSAASEIPSAQINKQAVKPKGVFLTPKPEHVDFYEELNILNAQCDYFKGFILSEVRIDGEPYCQLLCEDKDVKIIVDQNEKHSVIYHNGKQMEYEMNYLIGANAYTSIDLLDLTGDGNDELIIQHSMSGTGVMAASCDVINIDEMTVYPIDDFIYDLSSRVTIEPLKITEDETVLFKITDTHGNVYHGTNSKISDNLKDYSYTPSDENDYYCIGIDYEKKSLCVSISLNVDGHLGSYLGGIRSYMNYNADTNSFELSDDDTVNIDNPVKK